MDKERLEAVARKLKDAKPIKGYSASALFDPEKQEYVPAFEPNKGGAGPTRWQRPENPKGVAAYDLPDLKKRSERQRVESLANRLWAAVQKKQPGELEMILQMMQAEGWKRGQTISFEDVKLLAIAQMKRAAAIAKEREGR